MVNEGMRVELVSMQMKMKVMVMVQAWMTCPVGTQAGVPEQD